MCNVEEEFPILLFNEYKNGDYFINSLLGLGFERTFTSFMYEKGFYGEVVDLTIENLSDLYNNEIENRKSQNAKLLKKPICSNFSKDCEGNCEFFCRESVFCPLDDI